jgi:hypothetical protein
LHSGQKKGVTNDFFSNLDDANCSGLHFQDLPDLNHYTHNYYSHIASASSLLIWRADFHGQGATLVTPDNVMYSLPTISP